MRRAERRRRRLEGGGRTGLLERVDEDEVAVYCKTCWPREFSPEAPASGDASPSRLKVAVDGDIGCPNQGGSVSHDKREDEGGGVGEALERDWEQTKSDLPGLEGKDLDQDVDDTVKQATGKEPTPPDDQPNRD